MHSLNPSLLRICRWCPCNRLQNVISQRTAQRRLVSIRLQPQTQNFRLWSCFRPAADLARTDSAREVLAVLTKSVIFKCPNTQKKWANAELSDFFSRLVQNEVDEKLSKKIHRGHSYLVQLLLLARLCNSAETRIPFWDENMHVVSIINCFQELYLLFMLIGSLVSRGFYHVLVPSSVYFSTAIRRC